MCCEIKKYCENCGQEVDTKIVTKIEDYEIYGDIVEVEAKILVCAKCGQELFSEELDNETLEKAYEKYCEKHKINIIPVRN